MATTEIAIPHGASKVSKYIAGAILLIAAIPGHANTIFENNFNADISALQRTAILQAEAQWSNVLFNPVIITLNFNVEDLPTELGETQVTQYGESYSATRAALTAQATPGTAVLNNLPNSAQFTATVSPGNTLGQFVLMSSAEGQALGFATLPALGLNPWCGIAVDLAACDAAITAWQRLLLFDYDNSNGVSPGTYDFESVAFHEIGHALGFDSSVDVGAQGATNPTVLDLFRFSTIPTAASFATASRDLSAGGTAYFSDGTNTWGMSTGVGYQASHWLCCGTGIMDPLEFPGVTYNVLSAADLRAFSLIGWDFTSPTSTVNPIVGPASLPEPNSLDTGWYWLRNFDCGA